MGLLGKVKRYIKIMKWDYDIRIREYYLNVGKKSRVNVDGFR